MRLQTVIDLVEGFLETRAGLAIDFADGVFQRLQRLGQIGILRVQIGLALTLLGEFVDGGEIDRTQALNARGDAFHIFVPERSIRLRRQCGQQSLQLDLGLGELFQQASGGGP